MCSFFADVLEIIDSEVRKFENVSSVTPVERHSVDDVHISYSPPPSQLTAAAAAADGDDDDESNFVTMKPVSFSTGNLIDSYVSPTDHQLARDTSLEVNQTSGISYNFFTFLLTYQCTLPLIT